MLGSPLVGTANARPFTVQADWNILSCFHFTLWLCHFFLLPLSGCWVAGSSLGAIARADMGLAACPISPSQPGAPGIRTSLGIGTGQGQAKTWACGWAQFSRDHGRAGPGGVPCRWALTARAGDVLGVLMVISWAKYYYHLHWNTWLLIPKLFYILETSWPKWEVYMGFKT